MAIPVPDTTKASPKDRVNTKKENTPKATDGSETEDYGLDMARKLAIRQQRTHTKK